jgi:uncharacterized membrane protein YjjB (DUF3815 family)
MPDGPLGTFVTFCVFGVLGLLLARRFPLPVKNVTWLALAAAMVAGCFVGVGTALLSVFGFTIFLNWAIASFFFGMSGGLMDRTRRRAT